MAKKFMHDLEISKIGLVRKAANKRKFLIFKSEDAEEEDSYTMPKFIDLLKEKLNAVFEDEELVKAAAATGDVKSTDDAKTSDVDKVVKEHKLPDEVVAVIKSLQDAQAEQTKQIQDLQKTIQDGAAAREKEEIEKTAKGFAALPVEADKLAAALTALRKSDSESYGGVVEMLTKLDRVMQNSTLFDSRGTALSPLEKSAEEKYNKRLAEIRKEDPKLSEVEAMEKVYAEDPALYATMTSKGPSVGEPNETES